MTVATANHRTCEQRVAGGFWALFLGFGLKLYK